MAVTLLVLVRCCVSQVNRSFSGWNSTQAENSSIILKMQIGLKMSVWIMKLDSYRNGSSAQPEKRTWAWVAILFSGVGRSKLGLKFVITQQNPSFFFFFFFFNIFIYILPFKKDINYFTVRGKQLQKNSKKEKRKKTKRVQSKLHLHLCTATKKRKKNCKATFNNPLTA